MDDERITRRLEQVAGRLENHDARIDTLLRQIAIIERLILIAQQDQLEKTYLLSIIQEWLNEAGNSLERIEEQQRKAGTADLGKIAILAHCSHKHNVMMDYLENLERLKGQKAKQGAFPEVKLLNEIEVAEKDYEQAKEEYLKYRSIAKDLGYITED